MTKQDKFNYGSIPVCLACLALAFLLAWMGWI